MRLKVSNVCQLLDKSKFPANITEKGITFTNNGDGTITANGTGTENYASYNIIKIPRPPIGHKILVLPENNYNMQNHIFIWGGTDDGVYRDDLGYGGSILTITGIGNALKRPYTTISISLNVNKDWVMNNHIYKPQIFDLTEMYGAGNEPTTVEQFRQDFPNEMYEYSPVCWKKFRRLKYVTETKNLFDISKADITQHSGYWTSNANYTEHFYTQIVEPGKTYTVSYECYNPLAGFDALSLSVQTGSGFGDGTTLYVGLIGGTKYKWHKQYKKFTIPNGITQVTLSAFTDTMFRNLQIEEGSTASPYQPYGYLPLNRGKYIANKQPVQLLDKSDFKTAVSKGVTATPNTTNGMWTISGAVTAREYLPIGVYYPGTDFNIGDKLFLRHSNIDNSVYFPYAAWYDKDNKYLGEYDSEGVFSVTNPETAYIACYFVTLTVGDINVTTQVQLFNLTRMDGKGNEPTAAEFVAQYPGYDYSVNKYNAITFR